MPSTSILADHAAEMTMTPSVSLPKPSIHAQGSPFAVSYHADGDSNSATNQNVIQVLAPPSNPPTRQDWEVYRTIFTQLYRTENRKLKEVMSIMEAQYSFKAT
jgi:hypothetical protein